MNKARVKHNLEFKAKFAQAAVQEQARRGPASFTGGGPVGKRSDAKRQPPPSGDRGAE